MRPFATNATTTSLLAAVAASQSLADCGAGWKSLPSNFRTPSFVGAVHAMTMYDPDGDGPQRNDLIIAGQFVAAGGVPVERIARWDGSDWHPLADGLDNVVRALTVYDPDADGPRLPLLIAGGDFAASGHTALARIAAWDGTSWSSMGDGFIGAVKSLTTFDLDGDGPGLPDLFAGGTFEFSGETELKNLARWNGTGWEDFGGGITGAGGIVVVAEVNRFAAYDHDFNPATPPEMVVCGAFAEAGGFPISCVAAWNGSSWHAFGFGEFVGFPYANVYGLSTSSESASRLAAGGYFDETDGELTLGIAEWDGFAWHRLPGLVGIFYTLSYFDHDGDSDTPDWLVASGALYHEVLGSTSFSVWNGAEWTIPGTAIDGEAYCMATNFDIGVSTGTSILLGGIFNNAGGISVGNLAVWGAPEVLVGDIDCDGDVDLTDLSILLAHFGLGPVPPQSQSEGDVDGDSDVDLTDLSLLLANFGTGV